VLIVLHLAGVAEIFKFFYLPKNFMAQNRIYLHLGSAALGPGVLLSLLAGCASFRQIEMPPLLENLPASHELTALPFFPQKEYRCGPACFSDGHQLERFAFPT
jgi:hypothetical protein